MIVKRYRYYIIESYLQHSAHDRVEGMREIIITITITITIIVMIMMVMMIYDNDRHQMISFHIVYSESVTNLLGVVVERQ